MSKPKYEIAVVDGGNITVDISQISFGNIGFNATQIAKTFNKRPSEYLSNKQTKTLIGVISRRENSLIGDLVKIKKGGKYQGTWLSKALAIDFARWCSPEFAYELDKWTVQRLKEEADKRSTRQELKTGYRPLTDAITEAHDTPQHYHYSNEADLINKIVLGMSAKQYRKVNNVDSVRDSLPTHEAAMVESLQRADTTLHELGMSYTERKHNLTQIYLKKQVRYRITGGHYNV